MRRSWIFVSSDATRQDRMHRMIVLKKIATPARDSRLMKAHYRVRETLKIEYFT